MPENTEKLTPLEQMNQILSDKEAVIDAKLQKLEASKRELTEFQQELTLKVKEIQLAQEEITEERKKLADEWEKLQTAQKNLEVSMEKVLEEKVQLEQKNASELSRLLEEETGKGTEEEAFNLDALRQSIGMETKGKPVPNFGTEKTKAESETAKADTSEPQEPALPELFIQLEKEISKSYTKWNKLELFPERYCLEVGDREVRFFDAGEQSPVPYVQIVVFTQNARSSSRLLSSLTAAARVLPEWSIDTRENQIVCTMQFTAETKAAAVLKKCNDFIKNHLS